MKKMILPQVGGGMSYRYKHELIQEILKGEKVTIVDHTGALDSFTEFLKQNGYKVVMKDIDELSQVYDDLANHNNFKFKTNNWLKMHKKPMRRRPLKRGVKLVLLDEAYKLIDNPPSEEYIKKLYEKCRKKGSKND